MLKATHQEWTARRAQQEEAQLAAARAEQLREELSQARIELELELHERHRPLEAPPVDAADRSAPRRPGGSAHGTAVGVWFVAFYLLLALLASGSPEVSGFAVDQPALVFGAASVHEPGR